MRREDGRRMILGVSAALSEAEVHWRTFLAALKQRGIGIPDSITSDAHEILRAKLRAILMPAHGKGVKFHLQHPAQSSILRFQAFMIRTAKIELIFTRNDDQKTSTRTDSPTKNSAVGFFDQFRRFSAAALAEQAGKGMPPGKWAAFRAKISLTFSQQRAIAFQ